MKTKTTLLILMSLASITAFAQSSWTNYTNDRLIDDVLVEGDNIWVGSQGGLTRTNMKTGEFQTYLAANSPITGGGIKEIEKAPDNSLWFLSENSGVFQLKNGEWTNYYDEFIEGWRYTIRNLEILPNGDVWLFIEQFEDQTLSRLIRIRDGVVQPFGNLPEDLKSIAVLEDQSIFISNGDTIHRYDAFLEQVVEVFHSGNSIINAEERFREIIIDKNGTLILPSPLRTLQLKNGVLSVLSTTGANVLNAFKDEEGNIYLHPYTDDPNGIRLAKYDGSEFTYLKDEDLEPYPAADLPRFISIDHEDGLYAVIFNIDSEFTLFRFDDNGWTPVKTQIFPMLDNYQDDVQSDCKGNLWFSSRDGVDVRYADGSWEHFAIEAAGQLTNFSPGQMTVDPVTCDVWFGNNGNGGSATIPGIIRISNGTVSHFLLGHDNVHDVEATVDGKIFFFSGHSGFGYIQNEEIYYIDQLDELTFVTSIDSDTKGNLYLAAWGSTLVKYDGVSLTHLGAGELSEYVYDVIVDNDDMVWVDFSGGTKLFDGVNWTDYTELWPANTFNDIVQDRYGNYWVSTWRDGLYYWDKQTLQHYDIFNSGLSTNSLRGVELDRVGNLIVTQRIGASVLEIPVISEVYKGTGAVFFDYEKNGLFDQATDILVPGQKIRDTDQNLLAVTNSYGQYAFYGDTLESYQYLHELETDAGSTTDNPQAGAFIVYHSNLPDFGFWKPNVENVKVNIVNGTPVCNRDFRVHVFLQNISPYSTSGDFTLHFDDLLMLQESSIPITFETIGQLVFEDLSIEPFKTFDIKLDFTAPGLIKEGLELLFEGMFHTPDTHFVSSTLDLVLCSYDPNDKKVEPTGEYFNDYSLIKDPLKYTIRFQNEGTYKAFDITIIDTLDEHLNPSTFELLASSHEVETTITEDGIVTFIFRNIDLPTRSDDELASQGFVSFTVRPDSDLVGIERVLNSASIYFDFNPPIVTNTTEWNVVDNLAIVSTKEAYSIISVYPNPAKDIIYLTIDRVGEYEIWDVTGMEIQAGNLQPGSNSIQLNTHSGIFFIKVKDEEKKYGLVKVVVIR